ncbi:glycosyltransferase family 2 protein [Pantoea sp. B65]|uniref:glycosyltransferase family 2 protein n=1 Tax=Pantoea sp. B65 TaxID=2813359 RepID=UPI0039B5930C
MKNRQSDQRAGSLLQQLLARNNTAAQGELPFVSVVTPTWNRRAFLPFLLHMFLYQDYPADRRELVILDDSEQSSADLVASLSQYAPHPQLIRYYHQCERLTLGQKRNQLNQLARGEYIVCMDDDDYYRADKLSYTISEMRRHKALFAGCDSIPVWYSHVNRIYQTASIGRRHALNGTFACHRNFLKKHRYDDAANLAEESSFLKGFTVPVLQLDPFRSILCISHHANTYDKDFIFSNCQRLPLTLESIVTDRYLLQHYQRLNRATAGSKIAWEFIDRIVINAHSGQAQAAERMQRQLLELGALPQQLAFYRPASQSEAAHSSQLAIVRRAKAQQWRNVLVVDENALFVRQEKAIISTNKLFAALQHIPWDGAFLGCQLDTAFPLASLPSAVKVSGARQTAVASLFSQRSYDALIAALSAPDASATSWQMLFRHGQWLAVYPSLIYLDSDASGKDLIADFFKKLPTTLPNTIISTEQ